MQDCATHHFDFGYRFIGFKDFPPAGNEFHDHLLGN